MSSTTPIRSLNHSAAPENFPESTALPRIPQHPQHPQHPQLPQHPQQPPSQPPSASPGAPHQGGPAAPAARRTSFNFLRRKSSSETRGVGSHRSVSGGKMSKKQRALAQEEALRKQREGAMLPTQPPRLPSHSPLPQMVNFGASDDQRPDSIAIVSNRAHGNAHGNAPGNSYGNIPSRPSQDFTMTPHSGRQQSLPAAAVGSSPSYMDFDPYPRAESMTNRGRYSYASSAISTVNSPRRVRRRKDPTPFNILVIGAKGSGKTSFIEFLRNALALPAKKHAHAHSHSPPPPHTDVAPDSPFTSDYLESEVDGERVGVTLWDSQGLERSIIDFQLPVITSFLESKFEDTFTEEQKVVRAPGVQDTHIHCVFLILDPSRLDSNLAEFRKQQEKTGYQVIGGLDENLDLNVLRELQGKTTVIPVISKADTITTAHMRHLKKMVWGTIKRAKLDPLEALHLSDSDEEDEDRLDERDEDAYVQSDPEDKPDVPHRSSSENGSDASSNLSASHSPPTSPPSAKKNHARKPSAMSASIQNEELETPYLPLSIISPDPYEPDVIGRKFPWGFADPYNEKHCDFVRLRESVFSEWRSELREASREQWYEGWRTNRLQRGPAKRRTNTSDGNGLARQQLSVPSINGRASSAGSRDYRQERSTVF